MAKELSETDLGRFEEKLRARQENIMARIRDELARSKKEHYLDLAGQVHDIEEAAVADVLVDAQLAATERDFRELRRVQAALRRLREGTYGYCIDCGEPIDRRRLEADPGVARCLICQDKRERSLAPTPKD